MREGFDWPTWARTERGTRRRDERRGVWRVRRSRALRRSEGFGEGGFAGNGVRGLAGRVLERVEQLWEEENGSGRRKEEKDTVAAKEERGLGQT